MEKIFNKFEIKDIDIIKLEDIYSSVTIYSSAKEAKCLNFEAHHLIPIKIQMKNKNFLGKRSDFIKSDLLDDRCLRLSTFEHIIIHYILAKDLGDDYIDIFENMERYNLLKLQKSEMELINYLTSWSNLLEKGKQKRRDGFIGKPSGVTNKKYFNNGKINILLLEGQNVPEGFVKGRLKRVLNEDEKLKRSKKVIGDKNPCYGKKWYTNGEKTIYINPNIDKIPDGFYPGNLYNSYKRSDLQRLNMSNVNNSIYGKKCFNNGKRNIYLFPNEKIPDGFKEGRFFKDEDKKRMSLLSESYHKEKIDGTFCGSWIDYLKEQKSK